MISVNGVKIRPTIFPDGTSQVWKLPESLFKDTEFNIVWDFEEEAELFHLCQLCTLLAFSSSHVRKTTLWLKFERE